mmetsp:Transcript_56646/g.120507  ORF Transcript_56646/g.120507 Transcript_56646/m.120507 type:complete len:479 (+) Transcript_56646:99-1535(+)
MLGRLAAAGQLGRLASASAIRQVGAARGARSSAPFLLHLRQSQPTLALRFTGAKFCANAAGTSTATEVVTATSHLVKPGWEKLVGVWLLGASGMLFAMTSIGGYTRLSGSGLSMTDWRIEGRSLPRTDEAWMKEFEGYKQYPEYQRLHNGTMQLEDFKRIYFVEWFHRMFGRSAAVYFALPLAAFGVAGIVRKSLFARLGGLFGLGISQAFVGWWMVRSGFDPPEKHTPTLGPNQRPRVSPYRLASHWTAALTLYIGCLWQALTLLRKPPALAHGTQEAVRAALKVRRLALPVTAAVALTLLSGPFVAGNDAGRAYNTWPKMNYDWVPPEWLEAVNDPQGKMRHFFEETGVVQFNHRCLAYTSVLGSLALAGYGISQPLSSGAAAAVRFLPIAVSAQMCLGIATLLLYVPVELGVAHQAGGLFVLTALATVLHTLRLPPAGALLGAAAMAETAAAGSGGTAAAAAAADCQRTKAPGGS